MSFIEQLTAIMLLVDFLFGVTFGIIGSASLASRQEDRDYSLLHAPPDPLRDGVRVIHGFGTRGGRWAADAVRGDVPGDDGRHGGPGAQGQEPER